MHILGITGGIASGKSAVAAELAALGAVVLDADRAAHEVINLPDVQQALVDRWGSGILGESGKVNRQAVAQQVFSPQPDSSKELRFLEQTLHPQIRLQFEAELDRLAQKGVPAAVIDAPLLLEAGWESLCDAVLFVDATREKRLERAALRGWSEEDFSLREQAQMPIEEKRSRATQVVANQGSLEALKAQVQDFWKRLSINQ
ncbi:MAG: dephospho-CoA kinase [Planctomycetes bacterium]|nr:dephospho-CoA kinase [Planctomycetota bacterium]